MNKCELAREIIAEFPELSKKELGRLLFKKHPMEFIDAEDGRTLIRRVTDAGGSDKTYTQSDKYKGPLSIKDGQLNDFSHYKVTDKRIGMLYDIHLPYHDIEALRIAIDELVRQKVSSIILGGDTMDCFQISSFTKDPTADSIRLEIELVCQFLNDLSKLNIKVIFVFGNHEDRFQNFIMQKAPALYGIQCFELDNLIRIEYLRIYGVPLEVDFVKDKRVIDLGHLAVIHGHNFGESVFSPVNAARGFNLRAKANVIGGHQHQTAEHTESNINGKVIGAWSVGCLCDLHPKYRPINKWNHGFAWVERFEDNTFEVHNMKIIDGKIR